MKEIVTNQKINDNAFDLHRNKLLEGSRDISTLLEIKFITTPFSDKKDKYIYAYSVEFS